MKQVVQDMRTGKTKVVAVPVPRPGPGAVLVRTEASLISAGTERAVVEFAAMNLAAKARSRPDLVRQTLDKVRREGILSAVEAVSARLDRPLALGYSCAGTVVEVGPGVSEFRVGDRVACAGGGYAVHAEWVRVPVNLVAALPAEVDFESGAFATLAAIALHGFRLSGASLGESVAVIGLGLVGLLAVQIASAGGCRVYGVDLDPGRVRLAGRLGAQGASVRGRAERAGLTFTHGRGFDAVLVTADTSSSDPVELAGNLARDRGRVVAVGATGMELPRKVYYQKELDFVVSRSYGPGRYDPAYEEAGLDYPYGFVRWTEHRNLEAALELMAAGKLDVRPLISQRYTVEEAPQAYQRLRARGGRATLGLLLTYPGSREIRRTIETGRGAARRERGASIRLGVLGSGNFATAVTFPILGRLPLVERAVVVSASGLSAQQAAQRYGFARAGTDEEAVLSDPAIDAVAVLTRHHLHASQTIAALRAGKHVFCEKPLAISEEELDLVAAALRAASGRQQILMVGYNRRFAPMARAMRSFLEEAGEPPVLQLRVNAGYLPLDHWVQDPAQGGGRIVGEVCHFVDLAMYLAGAAPAKVFAAALPDLGHYRGDNVGATIGFANGALATLIYTAAGDRSLPKERVEGFAGGRVAVLDDFRRLDLYDQGRHRTMRGGLRQDKGHEGAWRAFAAAILSAGEAPISGEDLLAAARTTFALQRSLASGEAVLLSGEPARRGEASR